MRQNQPKPPLDAAWLRLATLSVVLKLALLACYMIIESIGPTTVSTFDTADLQQVQHLFKTSYGQGGRP